MREAEAVKNFFNTIAPIRNADWEVLVSKLIPEDYNKNEVLLKAGDVENYLSFISRGMVRLYIPHEEKDITLGFLFENEFVTAYDSLLTQSPSAYQVETLSQTTLWRISYKHLEEVYAQTERGEFYGRKMAEKMYLIKSKRELSFLSKTAEERYMDLFAERPALVKHIPLKYIASYIGVTPQALSRIRKRIT